MGKEYTEAQKKASMKYLQDKTDDIRLRLPKGTKDRWNAAASAAGLSMTQFVRNAVETAMAVKEGAER